MHREAQPEIWVEIIISHIPSQRRRMSRLPSQDRDGNVPVKPGWGQVMGRDTGCRTSRCLQLLAWIAGKDEIIPA